MMPTSERREVQPVDVDDRVERDGGDQPAAVEPLGEGDPAEDRARPQGAERIARREGRRALGVGRAQARVGERADEPDEPRQRDGGLAAEPVGEQPAGQRRDRRRGRPPGPEEPDDPTEDPGRVHRPPQAQVERAAERQAEPEDDRRPRSSPARVGERRRAAGARPRRTPGSARAGRAIAARRWPAKAPSRFAMNGAAARAARPIGSRPPRRAIVGSRVVTSAAVTPTPIDRDSVEGEVAPDRALMRASSRRAPAGSRVPRSSPSGLRGELSGSALGSPSRRRDLPRDRGSPVLREEVRPVPTVSVRSDSWRCPVGPGGDEPVGSSHGDPCQGCRGHAGSVEDQRPVRVAAATTRSAVSPCSLGPRREEGDAAGGDDPGVLARAAGHEAGRTDHRVGRLLAVPLDVHH